VQRVHTQPQHISVRILQSDQLSGKPGNVREFDSCQRNIGDFTKSQEINVREKILSGKNGLKLFIVSCILTLLNLCIFIFVLDHALLYSCPHHSQ